MRRQPAVEFSKSTSDCALSATVPVWRGSRRSILDLDRVSDETDFGVVTPLGDDALEELFGTTRPTREMVEGNFDFWEDLERGQGICFVLHKGGQPDELFFAGYSYD
jgi:hypothetical protein